MGRKPEPRILPPLSVVGGQRDLELDIGPSGELSYLLITHGDDGRQFEEGTDLPEQQALDLVRRVLGG